MTDSINDIVQIIDDQRWYPLLIVRGQVLFPPFKSYLKIGRAISQRAVNQALARDGLMVIATQFDEKQEEPNPSEIYRVGTIGQILYHHYEPEQILRIQIRLITRVRLHEVQLIGDSWQASVQPIRDELELSTETVRLAEELRAKICPLLNDQTIKVWNYKHSVEVISQCDAAQIAELVADHLYIDFQIKQELLETPTLSERLQRLIEIVEKECQKPEESQRRVSDAYTQRFGDGSRKKKLPAHAVCQLEDLIIWRHDISGVQFVSVPMSSFRPNPLVLDDLVIASVFSPGMVVAVDRATGKECWRRDIGQLAGDSPYYAQEMIFGTTAQSLYALSIQNGEIIWQFSPYGNEYEMLYTAPLVDGECLFISDRAGIFYCLDRATGNICWKQQVERHGVNINATALVHNDLVITASNGSNVFALEKSTGKIVWRRKINGPSTWELSRWQNGLIVITTTAVYHIDPDTGAVIHRWQWPARDIDLVTLGEDLLLIQTRRFHSRPYPVKKKVSDQNILLAIRDNSVIFQKESPSFTKYLRYDMERKLIYESRYDGFSILSANNGERLLDINNQVDRFSPSLPDIRDNIIYMVEEKGTIYALHHPTIQH